MTDETRERKDIYLAKAMGWRYVLPGRWRRQNCNGEGVHCLRDPEGHSVSFDGRKPKSGAWAHLRKPWFHEWESAKAVEATSLLAGGG